MKLKLDFGGLLILVAGALWGTTGVFRHLFAPYGLSSMMMSFMRVSSAILLMTPFMLKRGLSSFKMTKKGYGIAFIQGIFSQMLFSAAYFTAIRELGMSSAVVLLYTAPVYTTIMSAMLFGEKITSRKLVAFLITFGGCALTATGGQFDLKELSVYGLLLGLVAGFLYGTLAITGRYLGKSDDPLTVTYYTLIFGWLGMLVYVRPWNGLGIDIDAKFILIFIGSGLISSFIPYLAYNVGIAKIKEVSMAPILSADENISATLLGYVLFGETVGIWRVLGIALVLFAISIINKPEKQS